jgi:uncharacterized protein (DUF736 family)
LSREEWGARPRGRKSKAKVAGTDRSPVRSGQKRTRSTRPAQICWRDHHGCRRRVHPKTDGSYTVVVRALASSSRVQVRPVTDKSSDKSPDYRVSAGNADLGAAWKWSARTTTTICRSALGAPSFGDAINAALVVIDGVHTLVWSRSHGYTAD